MPHIQIEINRTLIDDERVTLAQSVRELFSEIMHTGTDHIATTIREFDTFGISIGRVRDHTLGVALINADIRQGRPFEQRRELVLALMRLLHFQFDIPNENIYVTITEHPGEDFHLHERFLRAWQEDEDTLT